MNTVQTEVFLKNLEKHLEKTGKKCNLRIKFTSTKKRLSHIWNCFSLNTTTVHTVLMLWTLCFGRIYKVHVQSIVVKYTSECAMRITVVMYLNVCMCFFFLISFAIWFMSGWRMYSCVSYIFMILYQHR